jgi:hypothetical protein
MKCYFNLETLGDKRLQELIVKYYSKEQPIKKKTSTTLLQEENKMENQIFAINVPDEDDTLETPTQPTTTVKQHRKLKDKPYTSTSSKILPRLQEFVNRNLITDGEAKSMSNVYGVKPNIVSHVNGLFLQDISTLPTETLKKRGIILTTFIKETEGKTLTEKQQNSRKSFIDKLNDVIKNLSNRDDR